MLNTPPEPTFPQTDSQQTNAQRERQGNVVDGATQEWQQDQEMLRQADGNRLPGTRPLRAETTDEVIVEKS